MRKILGSYDILIFQRNQINLQYYKTVKLLGNVEEHLPGLGVCKDFLDKTQRAITTKKKKNVITSKFRTSHQRQI